MEDFEKYVFDPENPTAFKAYDLLLKLSEQKPNAAFFDTLFFSCINQKIVLGDEFKKRLWDLPADYEDLDWLAKIKLYHGNYSEGDYYDFLNSLIAETNKIYLYKYLNSYLSFYESPLIAEYNIDFHYSSEISNIHFNHLKKIDKFQGTLNLNNNYNNIFLLNKEYYTLLDKVEINRTIILITTISDYQSMMYEEDNYFENSTWAEYFQNRPIKPILLKKVEDIHLLLDFLGRDIDKIKTNSAETEQKPTQPLQNLTLKNYFTIKNIQLENLQDKKEIYFLGKNGVGKTKLLQAILLAIRGNPNEGIVSDVIKENPNERLSLISTLVDGTEFKYQPKPKKDTEIYKNIIAYGVNRFRNDSEKVDNTGFLTLFDHEQYLNSPVQWLTYLDYKELKQDFSGISLERAKELIKDILEDITEIEVSPDGVVFYEKGVAKPFKALSDGFKTLITWLCDMTIRLAEKQTHASSTKDFSGIVIVDEIGMFLHPTWQYSLMKKIRNQWFPNIQFIFTTHSPIEILGASQDAVFYKLYKEDGITKVSKPVENKSISHLMLNGIVTAPFLFGLPSAKQAAFDENKDDLDTSDDYYTGQIREELLKRVTEKKHVNQEDIMNLLSDAFDEVEKELTLNDKD